MGNKTGN